MVRRPVHLWFVLLFALAVNPLISQAGAAAEPLRVVTAEFLPDREFPDLLPHIIDNYDLKHGRGAEKTYAQLVPVGATILLTVRNEANEPYEVKSLFLNGIDLARQIVPKGRENQGIRAAHYLLNDETVTPPALRDQLESLGQPMWYQARPNPVPPGGFAQVVVRLRSIPNMQNLDMSFEEGGKGDAVAGLSPQRPARLAIASVTFSDAIDRAAVYVRSRAGEEFEIALMSLDGRPVSSNVEPLRGSVRGFLPLEIPLNPPWEHGSFHHILVKTTTGDTAATVVRARDAFFALGMWGYRNYGNSDMERARNTCTVFRDHLFNVHMGMGHGGELNSEEGHRMLEELGMRLMPRDPSRQDVRWPGLYARFMMDEPDAHEDAIKDLPPERRLGAFAQGLVERQQKWTRNDPRTLLLLNVDLTYKPHNWITYGRLPDIFACDPYYQMRLADTFWKHPGSLGRNCTPFYVYAISEVARWSSEPNPLHILLNCVSFRENGRVSRFGTPEEKRVEFYYALAAGAKGISYWWFTPYGECHGCGSEEPEGKALLAETGRLNAEARALDPLLARSHPAAEAGAATDPFVSARPAWFFARTLVAGADTVVVVCVNRDHASDRLGTLFQPIPKVPLTFHTPPWMKPVDAFRLGRDGVIPLALEQEGDSVNLVLENFPLAEFLVITADPALRTRVSERWTTLSARLPASPAPKP